MDLQETIVLIIKREGERERERECVCERERKPSRDP